MDNLFPMILPHPRSSTSASQECRGHALELPDFLSGERFSTKDTFDTETGDASRDHTLLYMVASMYASILEDTMTAIRILGECNNELGIMKTISDNVLLRGKKYNIEQPTVIDELEGINIKDLGNEKYKLAKLVRDRKYVSDTLMNIYQDLSLNRSYRSLIKSISVVVDQVKYNIALAQDEAQNKITLKDLTRRRRLQRIHIKSGNYDTSLMIDRLRSEVEDAELKAATRSRYISKWQKARSEQHHKAIKDKELNPLLDIEYQKLKIDQEQRVHSEVELLISLTINDKLEQVEAWMDKYETDMEKMDLRLQIMKNNHVVTCEERMQLEDTLSKHGKLIEEWVHFKEERERARLYREKMNHAALTVQAWWRGLLVRLQLGPYKLLKKHQKAKKSKSKTR